MKHTKHPVSTTEPLPSATFWETVAFGAVAGTGFGALECLSMLFRFSRTARPLLDVLVVPVWVALLALLVGGALCGAAAGAAHPITRAGVPGKLAFGALVGAGAFLVYAYLLGLRAILAVIGGTALGVFVTSGMTLQDWVQERNRRRGGVV